jgi:hypothetical protein
VARVEASALDRLLGANAAVTAGTEGEGT